MISGEIRIGLVDGDESIREGRKLILNVPGKSVVVFEAERASEALELVELHLVDLLLVDQRIQGMTGVELCRQVSELKREGITSAHVIMTAPFANNKLRLEALRAGAQELVTLDQGREDLLRTIQKLVSGEVCLDLKAIGQLLGDFESSFDKHLVTALEGYPPKELGFIRSVVQGRAIAQVAADEDVAAYRVRKPVESLIARLGLTTLEQLQLRFIEAGLLDLKLDR